MAKEWVKSDTFGWYRIIQIAPISTGIRVDAVFSVEKDDSVEKEEFKLPVFYTALLETFDSPMGDPANIEDPDISTHMAFVDADIQGMFEISSDSNNFVRFDINRGDK